MRDTNYKNGVNRLSKAPKNNNGTNHNLAGNRRLFDEERHAQIDTIRETMETLCSTIKILIDNELRKRGIETINKDAIDQIVGEILSKDFLSRKIVNLDKVYELHEVKTQISGVSDNGKSRDEVMREEIVNALLRMYAKDKANSKSGGQNDSPDR